MRSLWWVVARGVVLGAALGLFLGLAIVSSIGSHETGAPAGTRPDPVRKAIARHHCSTSGFGSSAIPSSALIRTAAGHLALVSFDRGWAIHESDGAARLVAVCLDDPPR